MVSVCLPSDALLQHLLSSSLPNSEFLLGTGAEDGVREADFPGKEPWPFFFLNACLLTAHWVFIAAPGLSLVAASRGYSLVAVRRLLMAVASRCGARAVGLLGFSSCGTWIQ